VPEEGVWDFPSAEEKGVREAVGHVERSMRTIDPDYPIATVAKKYLRTLLAALQSAEQRATKLAEEVEKRGHDVRVLKALLHNAAEAAEAQLAGVVEALERIRDERWTGPSDPEALAYKNIARQALASINSTAPVGAEKPCWACSGTGRLMQCNRQGAVDCPECLPAQDVGGLVQRCPKCGSQVTPGWTYCKACGETNPAALSPRPVQPQGES
jgi:hypothetical protein